MIDALLEEMVEYASDPPATTAAVANTATIPHGFPTRHSLRKADPLRQ
jgi:hypothetical protein